MGSFLLNVQTDISPDMVLGKPVVTARGARVGEVLDVGVHNMDRVKFLLVGDHGKGRSDLVQLGVDRIEAVDSEVVVLKKT